MKQQQSGGLSTAMLIVANVLLVVLLITNIFVASKVSDLASTISGGQVPAPSGDTGNQAPAPGARIQMSADDDPALGPTSAKVTVIEFSDFQCPFCKRFDQDTWPQIKKDYVDTGKIRFVYRDFPLSFHQNAEIAAEASECADEQGKYWEMHDMLFAKGSGDGTGLDGASLKQYAAELKLDTAKFNTCLDSGKYKTEVAKDQADGSTGGVTGTPSFFIGSSSKNYQLVVGAQPYAAFKAAIDAELAK